jgi:hypothetical protein
MSEERGAVQESPSSPVIEVGEAQNMRPDQVRKPTDWYSQQANLDVSKLGTK